MIYRGTIIKPGVSVRKNIGDAASLLPLMQSEFQILIALASIEVFRHR